MKIYLAGSSRELDRCAAAMDKVRAAGHVITLDWVATMQALGLPEGDCDDQTLREAADADLGGVDECHWLIYLAPASGASFGAGVEWGYAVSEGKARIWVGPPRGCFATYANHLVPDLAAALAILTSAERSRARRSTP